MLMSLLLPLTLLVAVLMLNARLDDALARRDAEALEDRVLALRLQVAVAQSKVAHLEVAVLAERVKAERDHLQLLLATPAG